MRNGIVALGLYQLADHEEIVDLWTYSSDLRICTKMNRHSRRLKPIKHPQTLESAQGYLIPAHCSTSSKQTREQINRIQPRVSMFLILSLIGSPGCIDFGALYTVPMIKSARLPTATINQHFGFESLPLGVLTQVHPKAEPPR